MQLEERSFSYYLKPIILSVCISLILSLILLLVFSLVLLKADVSLSLINPITIVIMGISVFLGTFTVSRKVRRRGLFLGFSSGLLFFIIMLLISASVSPMGIGTDALIRALVAIFAGIFGGILGVNSKTKSLL